MVAGSERLFFEERVDKPPTRFSEPVRIVAREVQFVILISGQNDIGVMIVAGRTVFRRPATLTLNG
jgi:hypothetical protein